MSETVQQLEKKATQLRARTLQLVYEAKAGHIGSDLSCTDILTVLYYQVLNIDSHNPEDPNRDRYIQSKGHAAEILWTIMGDKGFITEEELRTFSQFDSRLIGHPNNEVDGIEMNTGSLGHGLAIATGIALAGKMDQKEYKTYTLMGDGELAEGSVWEAAMAASNYKLRNLTAIIDHNGLQISGKTIDVMNTEPLAEKWRSFGWYVLEVDGNSIEELLAAFEFTVEEEKPKMIIAHTVKGKGMDIAENQASWHHKVPTPEEYNEAMLAFENRLEEV